MSPRHGPVVEESAGRPVRADRGELYRDRGAAGDGHGQVPSGIGGARSGVTAFTRMPSARSSLAYCTVSALSAALDAGYAAADTVQLIALGQAVAILPEPAQDQLRHDLVCVPV